MRRSLSKVHRMRTEASRSFRRWSLASRQAYTRNLIEFYRGRDNGVGHGFTCHQQGGEGACRKLPDSSQQSEMICQQQLNVQVTYFLPSIQPASTSLWQLQTSRPVAQTPLVRFVVDLLYDKLYSKSINFEKSTTNRTSGVWAYINTTRVVIKHFMVCCDAAAYVEIRPTLIGPAHSIAPRSH